MSTLEQVMVAAERRLSALLKASGPFVSDIESIAHEESVEGRRIRAELLIRLAYQKATLAAYNRQEAAAWTIPPMRDPIPESLKSDVCECGHVRAVHRSCTPDFLNEGSCTECDCLELRQRAAEHPDRGPDRPFDAKEPGPEKPEKPEPDDDWTRRQLIVRRDGQFTALRLMDDKYTEFLADMRTGEHPSLPGTTAANARRLVACWNACMYIPTKTLECGEFNPKVGGDWVLVGVAKGGASDD